VVHLAGANIARGWTRAAKVRLRAGRVDATRLLEDGFAFRFAELDAALQPLLTHSEQ
jgi:NAD dependent epimerase/dehydratase family enzyme